MSTAETKARAAYDDWCWRIRNAGGPRQPAWKDLPAADRKRLVEEFDSGRRLNFLRGASLSDAMVPLIANDKPRR